jgi:L-alanine-DL-glutamate epimerase-like enolase superfamily enzyme
VNASLTQPIEVEGSTIAVPGGPGLGVQVNEAALKPHWKVIEHG